ncbi:MAG: type II toxin-antitoxin system HicB family antitoxin [Pseudomonadota bacterium]
MLKEKRNYIAVIKKNKSSDYAVIFPDFPTCITAGKTLHEAQNMAEEALQFHIDGFIEDKEEIPDPLSLDAVKAKYKKSEIFLIVQVRTPSKVTRINITIDEKFLRKLDKYLENHNENRSSFFVSAAREVMGH